MQNIRRKLVDKLCQNWKFDINNFDNIIITVNNKGYSRKIYNRFYPEHAYINFKGEKYYFEKER
jgi:hypothetical protein